MTTIAGLEKIAVFDLETTGLDRETARIVTAYIAVMRRDGSIAQERSWLLNPGIEIPAAASAVHGISTERAVAEGVGAATGVHEIMNALRTIIGKDIPIVAYNAPYDLTIIDRESRRYGQEPFGPQWSGAVIDPLVLDRRIDKYRRGRRTLSVTAEHYGVGFEGAHDARADAVATGKVAWAVLGLMDQDMTTDGLLGLQATAAREQGDGLREYLRRSNPTAVVATAWPMEPFIGGGSAGDPVL